MRLRKMVSALAAAALVASPVAVSAAQPLSPAARTSASLTAPNTLDDDGNPPILLIIGGIAVVLAILWLTDTWPFDDDDPDSP